MINPGVFPLLQSCVREVSRTGIRRECIFYGLRGLYIFAELLVQCLHVVLFVSWFRCLLYTIVSTTLSVRGLAC